MLIITISKLLCLIVIIVMPILLKCGVNIGLSYHACRATEEAAVIGLFAFIFYGFYYETYYKVSKTK